MSQQGAVLLANHVNGKEIIKPDSNVPGAPYNFDAIPVWLKPVLWNETKNIRFRGLLFVLLYTLSAAAFAAIIFVPVGFYKERDAAGVTALIWLVLSLCLGIPYALAVWWTSYVQVAGSQPQRLIHRKKKTRQIAQKNTNN
jgi:lysylphosphatidylglycerol synthetase-like protein (DUF2156 family)